MKPNNFNCAIISTDVHAADTCSKQLSMFGSVGRIDRLSEYPTEEQLTRLLRVNGVDLLIVDCTDLRLAIRIVESVRAHNDNPNLEIVAVCPENVKILSSLMRVGVHDYIPADAPPEGFREILASSVDKLRNKQWASQIRGDIFAFLPSKPGSGASTIAANTAFRASTLGEKRTLIVDLDREAPIQAFLNCLHPKHYLQEALLNSHKMESGIWSRLISQRGRLDILPADADGAPCAEKGPNQALLDFIRRAYDLICVDLPGPLDPCSVEVLAEAKRVYLVCTQELASVHIAMRKAERLRRLGLGKELRLLLNRYVASDPMTADRVADVVGLPVELTIPNSYALATASVANGAHVDPSTPLGKSYGKLAQILLNDRIEIPRTERKFLEYIFQPFGRRGGSAATEA